MKEKKKPGIIALGKEDRSKYDWYFEQEQCRNLIEILNSDAKFW